MLDGEHREDWRHERPLPAFGAWPPEAADEQGSLLSVTWAAEPQRQDDAATRHRLARLRREVRQGFSPAFAEEIEHTAAEADDFESAGFHFDDMKQTEWPDGAGLAEDATAAPFAVGSSDTARSEASAPVRSGTGRSGVVRSKRLVAVCGLLGAAAGGLVALSLPARYDATTQVQLAGGNAATFAGIDDQLRVVTSGIVLDKVVDKLGLADDPDFNGAAGDGGLVPLMRSLILRSDGAAASDAGQRHALAAGHLAASLSAGRGSGPAAIAVTASTGNGEKSALIANTVAQAFLDTAAAMRSGPSTEAERAPAADEAGRKLDVFLAGHGLTSADGRAAADALLKLDDQLAAARARTAELNGRIGEVRSLGVDAAAGGGLPQEFESGAMGELRRQYLAIKRESDRAAARLGPRNPERIALDTQLSGARDRIAAELRRIVASLQGELKQAVQAEQELASRLAQTRLAAEDIATLRRLREAAASVEAAPARNREEAAATAESMRIVARAYAPLEASGPPRLAITLAGLLLGIGAGVGLGAVRGRRRQADVIDIDPAASMTTAAAGGRRTPDAPVPTLRQAMPAQDPIDAGGAERMSPETAEPPHTLETAMYPVYADQMAPFAPQQPGDYPQPFPSYPYAAQPYGAQPVMPQPMPIGVPYVYTPYAPAHLWQARQAVPVGYYPYPQPPYGPRMAAYPAPSPAETAPGAASDQVSLEEIRASLREFREAVRELAESRSRRRYF